MNPQDIAYSDISYMSDSLAWRFIKLCIQLGVIASAIDFVLLGAEAPAVTIAVAIFGIVSMFAAALVDRGNFDHAQFSYQAPEVVDVVMPVEEVFYEQPVYVQPVPEVFTLERIEVT